MQRYKLISKKGEGTFSEVIKAQNTQSFKFHAIKCMKGHFEDDDQVNNLREIQAIKKLSPHPNIVALDEVLFDQPTGRLALVFELMDANLYDLIRGRQQPLNAKLVQSYMYQLLKSLDHMHRNGIFHRDIKPENILIEKNGNRLKLADFGSCRGIYNKQPYTEYISTRWYRAPECLLTNGFYGPEMDVWGAGCVLFEIISLYPLFPGSDEVDQINRIHKILGSPTAEILMRFRLKGAPGHINFDFPSRKGIGIAHLIPNASPDCVNLLTKTLMYDLSERITAEESMEHPYISELRIKDPAANDKRKEPIRSRPISPLPAVKPRKQSVSQVAKPVTPEKGAAIAKKQDNEDELLSPLMKKASSGSIKSTRNKKLTSKRSKSNLNQGDFNSTPSLQRGKLPAGTRLPKIARTHSRVEMQSNHQKMNLSQKPPIRRRRKKLYAHVSSSGYGAVGKSNSCATSTNRDPQVLEKVGTLRKKKPHNTSLPPIKNAQRGGRYGRNNRNL